MEKREIKNKKLPYLAFPWALHIKDAKEFLFISGVPPMNEKGKVVESDVMGQFTYEVERIKEMLNDAGMELSDVVFLGITVTEKANLYENWSDFIQVYMKYFPNTPGPAGGALRIVSGLSHPKMLIEIEATAVK
jgi:enamine deaminase RidA (YjgF/YER057c/UK114 family)